MFRGPNSELSWIWCLTCLPAIALAEVEGSAKVGDGLAERAGLEARGEGREEMKTHG